MVSAEHNLEEGPAQIAAMGDRYLELAMVDGV